MNDLDHLRNLLGRYTERIDAGDFAGVGALFDRGGLAGGDGPPFVVGADAVAAFYARGHPDAPGPAGHQAPGVGHRLRRAGARRHRRRPLVLPRAPGGGGPAPLQPIITGRYEDTFARSGTATDHSRDGGWYFQLRRFHVDLVGDLTHHLQQPGLADPPPVPSDG